MSKKSKILIIEDDELLLDNLVTFLSNNGFDVTGVCSAAACHEVIKNNNYDLAVVDLGLPDKNDFELVRYLREKTKTRIIILTAREQIDDKIQGYAAGADSYFIKPLDSWELKGCINSILSRTEGVEPEHDTCINEMNWHFDPAFLTITSPQGEMVNLTTKEGMFLALLIENSGRNVFRKDCFSKFAAEENLRYDNKSLDILVTRLRKKSSSEQGKHYRSELFVRLAIVSSAP